MARAGPGEERRSSVVHLAGTGGFGKQVPDHALPV